MRGPRTAFIGALLVTLTGAAFYVIHRAYPVKVHQPVDQDWPFEVEADILETEAERVPAPRPEAPARSSRPPAPAPRPSTEKGQPKVIEVPRLLQGVASDWYHGEAGVRQAEGEQRRDQKPLLLYFGTSWCGACRVFETRVVSSPDARKCFNAVIKARVDPDRGEPESELAQSFGVRGYPSVYVIREHLSPPRRISTTVRRQGTALLADPEAFARGCLSAVGL